MTDGMMRDPRRFTTAAVLLTSVVPLAVAILAGLISDQSWAYYVAVTLMSAFPIVIGLHDAVIDFIESIERDRLERIELARRASVVARYGAGFLRDLNRFGDLELSLMAWALDQGRNGLNRAADDLDLAALITNDLVVPASGISAQGFPYRFRDRTWVLMTEFADHVYAVRDRRQGLSPQHAPDAAAPPRPDLVEILAALPWMMVRALVMVAAGAAAALGMWVLYLAAMGTVAVVMIFGGAGIGALFVWLFG